MRPLPSWMTVFCTNVNNVVFFDSVTDAVLGEYYIVHCVRELITLEKLRRRPIFSTKRTEQNTCELLRSISAWEKFISFISNIYLRVFTAVTHYHVTDKINIVATPAHNWTFLFCYSKNLHSVTVSSVTSYFFI